MRKKNYPLVIISCLILMLACWNFLQAEEELYGRDLWDDAGAAMTTSWRLPETYATWEDNKSIGVVVLGMHRSGTSMLAGLLATACGYYTGEVRY